jgi:hypothetical protein
MPKIPLYNEGAGPAIGVASGQLSPRANVNAFTAPGRAAMGYQKTFSDIGQVAAQFKIAEMEREDVSINSEIINGAREALSAASLEASQTDRTREEGLASFAQASNGLVDNVKSRNLGKRRESMVLNNLNSLLTEYKIKFQENGFNNGTRIATQNFESDTAMQLDSLKGMSPGSLEFELRQQEILSNHKIAVQNGVSTRITEGQLVSKMNNIAAENNRLTISQQIDESVSEDDLTRAKQNVDETIRDAADRDVLMQKIANRSIDIKQNIITSLSNTVDITDVGTNEFKGEAVLQKQFNDVSNGVFADQAKQDLFDSLEESEKQQVIDGARRNLELGRKEIELKQKKAIKEEKRANDEEFIKLNTLRRNNELTFADIRNSKLTGVYGEQVKDQLTNALTNEILSPPVTEASAKSEQFIRGLVRDGKLSSVTERFITPQDNELGLQPREDGYSLLEREGLHISTQRVIDLESTFQALNNKEYMAGLGQLDQTIQAFYPVINPKLIGGSPMGRVRELNFATAAEEVYRKGIEEGKTSRQLLSPSSEDYIFKQDFIDSYRATVQDITSEQMDILKPKFETNIDSGIERQKEKQTLSLPAELQPYAPPIDAIKQDLNSRGISEPSKQDIINHPDYQSWKASPMAKIFSNGINKLQQNFQQEPSSIDAPTKARVVPRG